MKNKYVVKFSRSANRELTVEANSLNEAILAAERILLEVDHKHSWQCWSAELTADIAELSY